LKTFRYYDPRREDIYEADFTDSSEFIEGRCLIVTDGKVSFNDSLKYSRVEEIPEPARTELLKKAGISN